MNSPFSNLYLALLERIKVEVPDIRHIDQNLGQLDDYVKRPELLFPCVLIDFENWNFSNLGEYGQAGEGDITIYLGFARHLSSSNLTPDAWRQAALEYYEIEWALHRALHGWEPNEWCSSLTRTTAQTLHNPLGVRLRPVRYRVRIEDWSASLEKTRIAKPPMGVDESADF